MVNLALLIGLLTAVAVSFFVYRANISRWIKFSILTSLLAMGWLFDTHYMNSLGAPIQHRPVGEYRYIYHVVEGSPPSILLWTWSENTAYRVYQYPYTREDATQLSKAQGKKDSGIPPRLTFTESVNGGPGVDNFPIPDENYVKE